MNITYHKIIKFNPLENSKIVKLITRDNFGKKYIFNVSGFMPYAFISRDNISLLDKFTKLIYTVKDEEYNTYFNVPMLTVYFHNHYSVGKVRKSLGPEILFQADISQAMSYLVKENIGRYIKIKGDIDSLSLIKEQLIPMNQDETEKIKFQPYKKGFLDIEILSDDKNVFPDEKIARWPMISAVLYAEEKTIAYLLGSINLTKISNTIYGLETTIKEFNNESSLFYELYNDLNKLDVALAWSSKFEHGTLKNRSKLLGLDIDWDTIQWFNLQQGVARAQQFTTDFLSLKYIFDDIFMFKRHAWKYLPELFQEYFTEEEGKSSDDRGKGIVTVNEESKIYQYIKYRKNQSGGDVIDLYENNQFQELLFYNACDVWDMVMLEKVGAADSFFALFDNLALINMNDVFYHNSKIEPNALRFCMLNKVVPPSKQFIEGTVDKGALVHNPQIGKVHKNVFVTDFSRFYPSIILAKETSPENVDGNTNKMFTIMPNGNKFPKPMFFLPGLAFYLVEARDYAENKALEAKDDLMLKEFWKLQAKSLKDTTSGLWGYIAQTGDIYLKVEKGKDKGKLILDKNNNPILKTDRKKAGRFYALHIADEILGESRSKAMTLKTYIENNKICGIQFEVLYGDSDSVFIMPKNEDKNKPYDPQEVEDTINAFFIKICKEQGYPKPILVTAEKRYMRIVLVSKKFYFGLIDWKDGKLLKKKILDVKGMQAKRADHSQLSKDFQYSIIQTILNENEKAIYRIIIKMNRFIEQGFKEKQNSFIESISVPWKISRELDGYNFGASKSYKESAKVWNKYVIANNMGIDYILGQNKKCFVIQVNYCGIKGLTIKNKYLVFPQANLIDWSKIEINEYVMKNKTVTEKLTNILTSLGKEAAEIDTISKGRKTKRVRI